MMKDDGVWTSTGNISFCSFCQQLDEKHKQAKRWSRKLYPHYPQTVGIQFRLWIACGRIEAEMTRIGDGT